MGIMILMAALAAAPISPPSTADWLNIAFMETHAGNYKAAIGAYDQAIDSNKLNVPGKTLVYWNMFLINRQMKYHGSDAADNLFTFIVIAEDLEDFLVKFPDHQWKRFYNDQHIKNKLPEARCMLDHYWENRDVRIFSGCPR